MRRLALLLSVAVATMSVALVPISASAAVTDGGSLVAGQRATATFSAADDETTFSVMVPAGARPSVTFETPSPPAMVFVTLEWADGTSSSQGHYFSFDPSTAFVALEANALPGQPRAATLRLHGNIATTVSFALRYAQDISVPVTSGVPMTLDFADPAQLARLTFDAKDGARVHLRVVGNTLAPTTPEPDFYRPLTMYVTPQYSLFQESSTAGVYEPVTVNFDGPTSILIEPGHDLTGTLTLIATVIPADVPELAYEAQPRTIALEGTGSASAAFVTRGGARTMIQAVAPALTKNDGTQGSATLILDVPGAAPVTLGSVGPQAVTFPAGAVLEAGLIAYVRVVADGTTTGTFSLRVFLDPGSATPVTRGAANAVTVPATTGRGRFSFDAQAGETTEIYLTDIAFTDPGTTAFTLRIEDGIGGVFSESQLAAPAGAASFQAPATGTYTIDLRVNGEGGLTGTVFPVLNSTTSQRVPRGFDSVVATSKPGQALELVVPRAAGDSLVAIVTSVSAQTSASVSLTRVGEFGMSQPLIGPDGTAFLEAEATDTVGDWVLRIDPFGTTTAQMRVRLGGRQVLQGKIAPVGRPTPVRITEPGGIASYTFDGVTGDPLMLDLGEVTRTGGTEFDSFAVVVRRPDGSSFATTAVEPGSGPSWLEVPNGLDADGRWSVVVDPTDAATGSLTITRRVPRVLTGPLVPGTSKTVTLERPGDVRRLTFTGTAGRRPVVTFSDRTVATRVRLISPTGRPFSDSAMFDTSSYLELPVLPTSGTWTLELDPPGRDTGSVRLLLGLVADPVIDVRSGAATTVRYSLGQNPRLRIAVEKGAHLAVDLRTVQPAGTRVNVYLTRPDGTVASGQNVAAGDWVELSDPADVAGRWTVVLDPEGKIAGTIGTAVYAPVDTVLTGRVGKTTAIDVRTPAQNVILPFRGAATSGESQFVSWKVTDSTLGDVTVRLVSPDGTTVASDLIGPGDRSGVFPAPRDMNGRWQLVVDPVFGGTGRAKVVFAVGRPV